MSINEEAYNSATSHLLPETRAAFKPIVEAYEAAKQQAVMSPLNSLEPEKEDKACQYCGHVTKAGEHHSHPCSADSGHPDDKQQPDELSWKEDKEWKEFESGHHMEEQEPRYIFNCGFYRGVAASNGPMRESGVATEALSMCADMFRFIAEMHGKVESADTEQFRKASRDIVQRCNHALHHIAKTLDAVSNQIEGEQP